MFVKICGITSERDARVAACCGASAVGFVFCPSPRRVSPEQARSIRCALPSSLEVVGVFMGDPVQRVREVAAFCRLDAVQLHGDETPEICRAVSWPVIKAFRVKDGSSLGLIPCFRGVRAVLLDAWHPDREGGTGRTFDWGLAGAVVFPDIPLVLAGGLTPQNVASAVAEAEPWGVDVSSGVERRPGVKDAALVQRFVELALAARRGGGEIHRGAGKENDFFA
ncbi:MAG: phosphoribosylanthranilate isomerase [Deltaproteobacteria bacterium]|nr:phosphoribosylanthranilate isomerase [Deltaproteobacteria bacterium]